MAKITYTDKANLNSLPTVNAENKVSDSDMNEIKASVNDLYDFVNTNLVRTSIDGDWTIIKFGEISGTFIAYCRKQCSNFTITTSTAGYYESSYVDATALPTDAGLTFSNLSASETNGSQGSGVNIHRTNISSTKAQVMFWSPQSKTSGQNCPVFLILTGTWT